MYLHARCKSTFIVNYPTEKKKQQNISHVKCQQNK